MSATQISTSTTEAGDRALSVSRKKERTETTTSQSPLSGLGSFLSLALHPIPRFKGAISGLITAALAAGGWFLLVFDVLPSSRHVHVSTPIGDKIFTLQLDRFPQAAAIALAIVAVLFLIAGVRLAMQRQGDAA